MSIPFSDGRLGASFKEAVVILEGLECVCFEDDEDKEALRLDVIKYVKKALWLRYPYDCENYYYENPGNGLGAEAPDMIPDMPNQWYWYHDGSDYLPLKVTENEDGDLVADCGGTPELVTDLATSGRWLTPIHHPNGV